MHEKVDEDDESSSTEEEIRPKKEATQKTQNILDGVANKIDKKTTKNPKQKKTRVGTPPTKMKLKQP